MKLIQLLLCPLLTFTVHQGFAMGVGELRYSVHVRFFDDPFVGVYDSDETVNASTVRLTLENDFMNKRWSLRFKNAQTGSQDLTAGLDLTLGIPFTLVMPMYPKGDAQAVQTMVVQGLNLGDVVFDYTMNTVRFTVEPVAPAMSASHNGGSSYTAGAGVDFYYSGMAENPALINYGPPIVVTDAFLDDVWAPAHPSSASLIGRAIRVDGVDHEPVDARFIFGARFAAAMGVDFANFRGYVDGASDREGFTFSGPTLYGRSIDQGGEEEVFQSFLARNLRFSAVDIQVGVLPDPLRITDIVREGEGVRILWNAAAGRTYSIETRTAVDATATVPVTGLTGADYLDVTPPPGSGVKIYRVRED
jgi:hypothetical protein